MGCWLILEKTTERMTLPVRWEYVVRGGTGFWQRFHYNPEREQLAAAVTQLFNQLLPPPFDPLTQQFPEEAIRDAFRNWVVQEMTAVHNDAPNERRRQETIKEKG